MKKIQIFLGGGVKLLHSGDPENKGYRNDVVDPIISQLNSQEHTEHIFVVKDYSDLTRNVVEGAHQTVYDTFIQKDAQIALFILDGKVGAITKDEISCAVSSARKLGHPIVFIYGKDIKEDDPLFAYVNKEKIYFQHFADNRDLMSKIKSDIESSVRKIEHTNNVRKWLLGGLFLLLSLAVLVSIRYCNRGNNTLEDSCSVQLYQMRYKDVNVLAGIPLFNDSLLLQFKYDDSVRAENDRCVYPIYSNDSVIKTTPPFFRVKLHNKYRNTVVFVEAMLEIDQYIKDTLTLQQRFEPVNLTSDDIDNIIIKADDSELLLKKFRQSVAYGEIDDRYCFSISSPDNCSFRMRVRAKSQTGEYLYSNYVYVKYMR